MFFDNLQVIHTRGAMLEETHYYPYGMKMAGISAKAFSALHNPYQYQGDYSEFDETTGWNDFYLRSYDAQTGRFNGADPYDQFASPYTGMGNNPVNGTDPSGGFFDLIKNLLTGEVFDDKNIGSESAFLSSSYNNGSYMYLGEGESKFLPGVFIMANNNYSQQFAAWKFLPSSLEVGLGAGVLEWVKNISVNAYEHSIIGGLTTSYSELEDRGNAIRGTLQSAAEFLSLPSSQSVSIAGAYLRTKLNNFINSTPYDQGRILGNVVPDLAVAAALPELKASSAGEIAAKGVDKVKYIGRLEDLKGIPRSQTLIDDLPNLESPKANYYQNMSVLRKALRDGYTIKDASWFRPNSQLAPTLLNPNRTVGQTFLGAERNLLNNRGLWP